jgi:tetratricopeptide (TPR) repeat protein
LNAQPAWGGLAQTQADTRAQAERGLKLARAGKLEAAESELRRAVARAPNDPSYLTDLGTVLAMEKKLEESTACFTKALQMDPADLTTRRYLAANLWQLRHPEEAKRHLEIIRKAAPDDRNTVLLLGMVSENLKDYTAAAGLLASVPDLVCQRPESIAALARSYYRLGKADLARQTMSCCARQGATVESTFLCAQIAEEAKDFSTATRLLESLRGKYPDPARLELHLAQIALDTHHPEEGRRRLEGLVQSGNASAEAYNLLGRSLNEEGKLAQARGAFEAGLSRQPKLENTYLDLALLLQKEGKANEALETAQRCREELPNSYPCAEMKGEIERGQDYYRQAVESFAYALRLRPDSAQAEFGLATSLAGLGKIPEASQAFEATLKFDPTMAPAYIEYAKLMIRASNPRGASSDPRVLRLVNKGIQLSPENGEARYLLGYLLFERGRYEEALSSLQAASRLSPQDSQVHYLLWRCYEKLGKALEAVQELRAYQELSVKPHDRKPE